jgi:outer membrane lipoprotein-sorting protein
MKRLMLVSICFLSGCGQSSEMRQPEKAAPEETKQLAEKTRSIEQAADEAAKLVEADSIAETK